MSSTTCTSLPQLEKVHTIAGTTQRSRAQVHPPTTPCVVDALLQYSTKVLSSKQYSTHQLCASQRAAENGDGDRDCRGWSTELCQTMLLLMVAGGGVRSDDAGRGECWRRVSGRVQLLVVGETRRAYCVIKRFCCIVGVVVVVVEVEERIDLLERDKGGCWSRRAWRENSGVVESCCVRPWSSDKFGRLDVEQRDGETSVGVLQL